MNPITVPPILWILFIISISFFVITLARYMTLRYAYLKARNIREELEFRDRSTVISYSKEVLDLVRKIVGENVLIRFREFVDGRNMGKVTEANIKNLIRHIAEDSRRSLNLSKIIWDNTIFDQEYIDGYIVDVTVMMVKDLLESDEAAA